jgi:hypothetical protein
MGGELTHVKKNHRNSQKTFRPVFGSASPISEYNYYQDSKKYSILKKTVSNYPLMGKRCSSCCSLKLSLFILP